MPKNKSYKRLLKKLNKIKRDIKSFQGDVSESSVSSDCSDIENLVSNRERQGSVETSVNPQLNESFEDQSSIRERLGSEEIDSVVGTQLSDNGVELARGRSPTLDISIDDETRKLLERETEKDEQAGIELHHLVAARWTSILVEGLKKENRAELLKKYPTVKNCNTLKAPVLNPEVHRVLTESSRQRDNFKIGKQNQLAAGLSALAVALNILIPAELQNKSEILNALLDAGKLITDVHYRLSVARRAYISPHLNNLVADVAKSCPIDNFLYGNSFTDKIRSAQQMERVGKNLRPTADKSRTTKRKAVPPNYGPEKRFRNSLNNQGPSQGRTRVLQRDGPQPAQRRYMNQDYRRKHR